MPRFATFPKIVYYEYKLPDGIEDLDYDENVEEYGVNENDCCLYIKLKDNDEEIKIEPTKHPEEDDFHFQEYPECYDVVSDDEDDEDDEESDDEDDDWKYLCPNLHWGGQYGCDLCCDHYVKDIDNQEMEKEWLNSKNKYCYKLHKKWLQDKKQKEVSFKLAINKLKRNKLVNNGFLLKVSIMKCGMF